MDPMTLVPPRSEQESQAQTEITEKIARHARDDATNRDRGGEPPQASDGGAPGSRMSLQRPRRRIWIQHVAVETDKLRMRLSATEARGNLTESQQKVAEGIYNLLGKARDAAFRDDPVPGRWANWWRGTLVEAAYRNLHAARAQMVDIYDKNQLRAEIPLVVARANETLHRDDPRRITVEDLEAESVESLRPRMRRVISDSY
jgi:hypothetical protein